MLVQLKFYASGVMTVVTPRGGLSDAANMLYAACNLTYTNITAHYDPVADAFDIIDSTPSSPSFVTVLWVLPNPVAQLGHTSSLHRHFETKRSAAVLMCMGMHGSADCGNSSGLWATSSAE